MFWNVARERETPANRSWIMKMETSRAIYLGTEAGRPAVVYVTTRGYGRGVFPESSICTNHNFGLFPCRTIFFFPSSTGISQFIIRGNFVGSRFARSASPEVCILSGIFHILLVIFNERYIFHS